LNAEPVFHVLRGAIEFKLIESNRFKLNLIEINQWNFIEVN